MCESKLKRSQAEIQFARAASDAVLIEKTVITLLPHLEDFLLYFKDSRLFQHKVAIIKLVLHLAFTHGRYSQHVVWLLGVRSRGRYVAQVHCAHPATEPRSNSGKFTNSNMLTPLYGINRVYCYWKFELQ